VSRKPRSIVIPNLNKPSMLGLRGVLIQI